MIDTRGLIHAIALDGQGGGKLLTWDDIQQPLKTDELLWIHLDYEQPDAIDWLQNHSGLQPIEIDSLLAEASRPRCVSHREKLLLNLRGVNTNPGADPEDMVSIRLVCQNNRIISTRRRRLLSVQDIANSLKQGHGPKNIGELCSALTRRLIERMRSVINELDEDIDELEASIINSSQQKLRGQLINRRREIIQLRRFLSPQREALAKLQHEEVSWLNSSDRLALRESADQLARYLEDLDSCRDRAAVIQEELASLLAEAMNKRMYLLSIVTAVFLPLGFLTGLFGINVGGIPLAENPSGFIIISSMIVFLVLLQVVILRLTRWF